MKKSALYLSERVRHQMVDEFCIPLPPPADMRSKACTWAIAHAVTVVAHDRSPRYFFRGTEPDEYQNWFHQVGKPYLFVEEL